MNDLFHGFKFICAYIGELLFLTKEDWSDYVHRLELTFNKLMVTGNKCNNEDSFFGKTEMTYLGFGATRNGAKRIIRKIDAIPNMKPPTSRK